MNTYLRNSCKEFNIKLLIKSFREYYVDVCCVLVDVYSHMDVCIFMNVCIVWYDEYTSEYIYMCVCALLHETLSMFHMFL